MKILSLGSNIGNRAQYLSKALEQIEQHIGKIIAQSAMYETPAWGFSSQPFFNMAVAVQTKLSPMELLNKIHCIEESLGRVRYNTSEYQPRTIDIDIVTYDNQVINTQELTVPHRLMSERKFVLIPCADIDNGWKHPVLNQTFAELLNHCKDNSIIKKVES